MKDNLVRLKDTKGMQNLTVLVTSKCTLKCKLCATYASHHPSPSHYSYDVLVRSVSRYFDCSKKPIGLITISGGEPFLHPQLADFLEFIAKYDDRVRMIEIITNATIIPNKRVIEALKKSSKFNLLVDDYGEKLSVNLKKFTSCLDENDIAYRLRNYTTVDTWCDGWIDVSDFSEKNRKEEEICNLFERCAFNNIYRNIDFLINGKIHMCYVINEALPQIEELPEESVDMLDDGLTNDEIYDKIQSLRERNYLMACKNCNGYLIEGGIRRMPAEQM